MPKGETIKHGSFNLNFKTSDNGEVQFRFDNTDLEYILNEGYLSTSQFHNLRAAVNHGVNHLNKYYDEPEDNKSAWTEKTIQEGSIIRVTGMKSSGLDVAITEGKLYVISEKKKGGGFKCADDKGRVNYAVSNYANYEVVQY